MKKGLLLAVVATVAASSSYAQSKFEGAYGQVGIGYSAVTPGNGSNNLTAPNGTVYPLSTSLSSSNSFTGAISAGYTFNLDKQFTLGLGVDYTPFAGSEADYSFSSSSLTPSSMSGKWKQNNAYNIYLAPGFAIAPDKLAYAKLGYAGTQVKSTPNGGTSGTTNLTGYLVGLGYKQIITGGIYGFGEVNYTSYGNQSASTTGPWSSGGTYNIRTDVNANALTALVGVGYKF